jgi:exopolyphosphatase/guanosine-5'-triphosphate,3'-diphosphate pyrophosphatase
LRGFEPQEIEVIALIARYHRQAEPKRSHEGYGALDPGLRRIVKRLGAMVRLAEGLDRSHSQAISRVDLYPRQSDYLARLRAQGDAELELWAAHRHVEPLERILGKTIRFELTDRDIEDDSPNAEQTDNAARVPGKAVRRRRHRRLGQDDTARPAGEVA